MRPDDFFVDSGLTDPFGIDRRRVNTTLLDQLRRGPLTDHDDLEVAVSMARLIHDDLERCGTDSSQELTEEEMRSALLAFRVVLQRIGVTEGNVPFRAFGSFKTWWVRNGAYGSWQARRDLLNGIFEPLHAKLALLEERALSSTLVEPVSPLARTGWPGVDIEISELRRHFLGASSPQDYRNVGNDCVSVTESLSRQVYDPDCHLRAGEEVPPVANTKV